MLAHTVKHLPSFISIYFHDFPFLPVLPFPFSCVPARPNHIPLCSALPCCAVLWCDVVRSALPCLDLLCSALPCLALPCPALPCPALPCAASIWRCLIFYTPVLSLPIFSYAMLCNCAVPVSYFFSAVGDPEAPKSAFRHTGLDTYAVRSPPTLTASDCATGCCTATTPFKE